MCILLPLCYKRKWQNLCIMHLFTDLYITMQLITNLYIEMQSITDFKRKSSWSTKTVPLLLVLSPTVGTLHNRVCNPTFLK